MCRLPPPTQLLRVRVVSSSDVRLGLQLDLEVDVLAAPPCGGGGSQIMIRYSIATGLRAVLLGRLGTRGVDLRLPVKLEVYSDLSEG